MSQHFQTTRLQDLQEQLSSSVPWEKPRWRDLLIVIWSIVDASLGLVSSNLPCANPCRWLRVALSCSLSSTRDYFRRHLGSIEAILVSLCPVIIPGDLNAKQATWNSRTTNIRSRSLHTLVDPFTYTFHTSIGHHRLDVINIAIHRHLPYDINIEDINALSSDHTPILLTITAAPTTGQPPSQ